MSASLSARSRQVESLASPTLLPGAVSGGAGAVPDESKDVDDELDDLLRAAGLLERKPLPEPSQLFDDGSASSRDFAGEFDAEAAAEEVVIGLLPEEELAAREKQLAAARAAEEAEAARKQAAREQAVREKEAAARLRIAQEAKTLQSRLDNRAVEAEAAEAAGQATLHRAFRAAEASLQSKLEAQQALVAERYGRLVPGRAAERELRIDWAKLPQPVELRVLRVRAVKNKLPSGRYVMLCTLYDRLGGNPLRWTKIGHNGGSSDGSRPGATTAVRHRGRFYDTELPFNQCVYAVAPAAVDLQPSHVFVFELFLLGGRSQPMDRVVAWTALPACDRDFAVPVGRFRLPLLRGEVDLAVTRYRGLEDAIAKDLDAWLGNLYLETLLLPREAVIGGVTHREFDVALAASSAMLRLRGEHRRPVRPGLPGTDSLAAAGAASGLRLRRRGAGPGAANDETLYLLRDGAALSDDDDDDDDDASLHSEAGSDEEAEAAKRTHHGGGSTTARGNGDDDADAGAQAEDALLDAGFLSPSSAWGAGAAAGLGASNAQRRKAHAEQLARVQRDKQRNAEWTAAQHLESNDVLTEGPAVVADSVTRGGVLALGQPRSVRPAPPILASDAAPAAAASIAAGGAPATATAAAAGVLSPVSRGVPPLAQPASSADATGTSAPSPSPSPAGGSGAGAAADQLRIRAPAAVHQAVPGAANARRTALGAAGMRAAARGVTVTGTGTGAGAAGGGSAPVPSLTSGAAAASAGMRRTSVGPTSSAAASAAASAAGASALAPPPASTGGVGSSASAAPSTFSYAVNKQEDRGLRGSRVRESLRKLRFLRHELVADLSFGSALTFDFWLQLALLLVALWLRIYLHYLGQWFYLRILRIPVYAFTPLPYACTLKYVADALPNEVEIGAVLIGPAFVIACFGIFAGISWLCQAVLGTFPEIPSRFIAYFGLAAMLDPPLIAIVDAAAGRYDCAARFPACATDIASALCECSEGDAWKLPARFVAEEGSPVVGIVLTVFAYLVLMLLAGFGLYAYLLRLHLDGRMIDLFRRLHGEEDRFSIPHDFEVSPSELQWIVSRAHRWRGPRGTTRRVAVCDYVLSDPLDPAFKETTSHLIIYHAGLDGSRELYRHFLRLPDGTLLEIFGSMERQLGIGGAAGAGALQELLLAHGARAGAAAGDEDGAEAAQTFFAGL